MDWIQTFGLATCCSLCQAKTSSPTGICDPCFHDLPRIGTACRLCAKTLPANGICGDCAQQQRHHRRMLAAFRYEFPLDTLIHDAKYRHNISSLILLSRVLREEFLAVVEETETPDYIVPVPLHSTRFRQRGFNQSLQMIKPLAKTLDIPLRADDVIRRTTNTAPQSELDKKERHLNIKNAFETITDITGDRIVIFDDIISTGSTVYEIARVLKRAGAADIQIWCFARNLMSN